MVRRVTLLFCHGGGLCKEVWHPITRRLQDHANELQIDLHCHTFDFPYHGTRRDVSVKPILHLDDPDAPHVEHPASQWPTYLAEEVIEQLAILKKQDDAKTRSDDDQHLLIGIGHSMGGAALWKTESEHPGTFDALILFEPICNLNKTLNNARVFLIKISLQRPDTWPTLEAAQQALLTTRNFRRWDAESLQEYVQHAVVELQDETTGASNGFGLVCPAQIEASLFCTMPVQLSPDQLAQVRAQVFIEYGGRTHIFSPKDHEPAVQAHPERYHISAPIPDTTHVMIMEKPELVAERILHHLQQLL